MGNWVAALQFSNSQNEEGEKPVWVFWNNNFSDVILAPRAVQGQYDTAETGFRGAIRAGRHTKGDSWS